MGMISKARTGSLIPLCRGPGALQTVDHHPVAS